MSLTSAPGMNRLNFEKNCKIGKEWVRGDKTIDPMIREGEKFYVPITDKRCEIDMWLFLDTNEKSYTRNLMEPLDLS